MQCPAVPLPDAAIAEHCIAAAVVCLLSGALCRSMSAPYEERAGQYFRPRMNEEIPMLLWIAIIIAVLWLLGLLANIGGGLIHILLVVAVIVLIIHFVQGRRRV